MTACSCGPAALLLDFPELARRSELHARVRAHILRLAWIRPDFGGRRCPATSGQDRRLPEPANRPSKCGVASPENGHTVPLSLVALGDHPEPAQVATIRSGMLSQLRSNVA